VCATGRGYGQVTVAMAVSGELRFKVLDAAAAPDRMLAQALDQLKRMEHGLLKYL